MRKIAIAFLLICFTLAATAQTKKDSPEPPPKIKVGDPAPDLTLLDQDGKPHSLHDYKGKQNVVLAFYVFAFTPG
jgi:cytochrome oxidase Cu insertion factor (SCO1/SenC/PrrC family)